MAGQQVIEFALDGERYCIGIEFVSEVVRIDEGDLTAVPASPPHVEGVVDLRGETTRVVNPYTVFDIAGELDGIDQLLVFDAARMDGDAVGWLVDDVYRVTTIEPGAVDGSPADREGIEGVVNRDDGFLIWTAPDGAMA